MQVQLASKRPHKIIDTLFVETTPAKKALAEIQVLRDHGLRHDCCECLLLAGPSRVGKSAVLAHYTQQWPAFKDGLQQVRPVVIVEVEADTRLSYLISMTLRALGDPRPDYGTPGARTDRVFKLIEKQRIDLLVYDEFQHLIDSDTNKIAYKAGDVVKTILGAKLCKVVMSGITHAERVLHTNSQLIGRARPPVYMKPADWRDHEQQLEFRIFLNEIEKKLGLPAPSGLGNLSMAHRIHHFSRGLYGYAHNLIREALLIRLLDGEVTPCLTPAQFARAADRLLVREPKERLNAFHVNPPDEYEPAPAYESLKEPSKRGGGKDADGFN